MLKISKVFRFQIRDAIIKNIDIELQILKRCRWLRSFTAIVASELVRLLGCAFVIKVLCYCCVVGVTGVLKQPLHECYNRSLQGPKHETNFTTQQTVPYNTATATVKDQFL